MRLFLSLHLISQRVAFCRDRPPAPASAPAPSRNASRSVIYATLSGTDHLPPTHYGRSLEKDTTAPNSRATWKTQTPVTCRTANKADRTVYQQENICCSSAHSPNSFLSYLLSARHTPQDSQWSHLFIESTIHICSIDGRIECEVFPVFTLKFFKFAISWGTVPFKHKIMMLAIYRE